MFLIITNMHLLSSRCRRRRKRENECWEQSTQKNNRRDCDHTRYTLCNDLTHTRVISYARQRILCTNAVWFLNAITPGKTSLLALGRLALYGKEIPREFGPVPCLSAQRSRNCHVRVLCTRHGARSNRATLLKTSSMTRIWT